MKRTHLQLSALSLATLLVMSAQAQSPVKGQAEALARLSNDTGNQVQVSTHAATGSARFVRIAPRAGLKALNAKVAPNDAAKQAAAAQFLSDYAGLFGISNAAAELGSPVLNKDRYGGTHFSHKQLYQGIPVLGGELKSHFDRDGNLTVVNGSFVPGIDVNPKPSRSADSAAATALAAVTADLDRKPAAKLGTQATLMIYREGLTKGVPGSNHLAWQVEVSNKADVREFIYVDAHSGKIIDRINGIHEAMNRRAFDGKGETKASTYPGTPFWVEGQPLPTGVTEADNMINASGDTYNLFKNAFGRDSFDGKGATMDSIFNRGDSCPNASWNGTFISFCPGTTTDDITAHEWGHAYTQHTHGLIYSYQSGALNEAYSDIWGETVDRLNGRGGDSPDQARTQACTVSTKVAQISIAAPVAISGAKLTGTASFGPQTFSVNGAVAGAGAGCSAGDFPASVNGKIAYVDRGTCPFTQKVKNAQNAGAIGVIVGNNAAGAPPGMGGTDATITIPALSLTQADGTAVKNQLSGNVAVTASLVRGSGSDNSVRWLMGEDASSFGGAIRDMYNPTCYGHPGKVSDAQYTCGTGDNGGVHSNSGVPNHGFALLVDGGSYNGQDITAIGLTKAAHIYYRAQSVYQGPASNFADHADALEQSCRDLTGQTLKDLKTGADSADVITAGDCTQVAKMALAVELRTPPSQCNYKPLLAKNPPALCSAGSPSAILSDNFEGGRRGGVKWMVSYVGNNASFTPRNFGVVNNMPERSGYGIMAADANYACSAGSPNQAGLQRLESPEFTVPAGVAEVKVAFDHYVATEAGYDGGNLKYSVNGGAWTLVPATAFVYNPYNANMTAASSDSPLVGQPGFTGTDAGSQKGSWGRSIVNLAALAGGNDKVKLRFEFGNDSCGGTNLGWYLDDIQVYSCKP